MRGKRRDSDRSSAGDAVVGAAPGVVLALILVMALLRGDDERDLEADDQFTIMRLTDCGDDVTCDVRRATIGTMFSGGMARSSFPRVRH